MDSVKLPILEVLKRNFHSMSDEYKALALKKDRCRKCSIYNDYEQVVQAEGNAKDPTLMIVGEAPGADEVEQLRPFIGKAGQRLREELAKHKAVLNQKTTLISNTISCRPFKNQFPKGKEPKICCDNWLKKEIKIAKPRIVLILGNQALMQLRGCTGITRFRGQWELAEIAGRDVITFATFHPSYVIRSEMMKKQEITDTFAQDISTVADEVKRLLESPCKCNKKK